MSSVKSLFNGPDMKEKFSSILNVRFKNITVVLYN